MVLDLSSLQGIPKHILPENIKSVQFIKGGLNNRNILINDSFLLKEYLPRDEKNDPVHLRYSRESSAFTRLLNADFMPELFKTHEVEKKYFLTRSWIEGTVLNAAELKSNIENLVSTLSILHNQQYSSMADYHYFDVIERYIREYSQYKNPKESDLPKISLINAFYKESSETLIQSKTFEPLTRIHGDLVFSNIIKSDQRCFLIDWEYTTCGEPLIDLAYLVTQNSISSTLEALLLNTYKAQNNLDIDLDQFSSYKDLMNLMSALWYALQVMRLQNDILTHSKKYVSDVNFKELAIQGFKRLEI